MRKEIVQLCAVLITVGLLAPPALGGAFEPAVMVATNIAGDVSVQSASGARRVLVTTQVLHSGDVLTTADNSLAVVRLADVGKVTLGPATTAATFSNGTDLSLQLSAGTLCVQSERPLVSINAGSVTVAATVRSSIFNLEQNNGDTKMAVYRGTVSAATPDHATTLRAGAAAASAPGVDVHSIPLASIHEDFAALNCPDASVVNSVLPQRTAQPLEAAPHT
ncbi:MAG: FecR domain-containing protein [Candidatus Eremiobacteraeota bacterium]|nr:FecR domain-containing protein [Candidatus Eremiobacteraeota bacterium]